jgi:hypothetical protein
MPALIPRESQNQNAVWVCSDCDTLFAASHPRDRLAPREIARVNTAFLSHCRRHLRKSVILLLPEPNDPWRFGWLMQIIEWFRRQVG